MGANNQSQSREGSANRGWAILAALIVIGLLWSGIQRPPSSSSTSVRKSENQTVTYIVEGDGYRTDVTIEDVDGTSQYENVRIPYEKKLRLPSGSFVYISAQSADDKSRKIECRIEADGVVIARNDSEGRFVIASCSGSLP